MQLHNEQYMYISKTIKYTSEIISYFTFDVKLFYTSTKIDTKIVLECLQIAFYCL